MKKQIFPLLCIIFLGLTCKTPKNKISSETLFQDIAANYNLSDYKIFLNTGESMFYLSDVHVTPDGKIVAMAEERNLNRTDTGARMMLYTRKQSNEIIERIVDSAGINYENITFGNTKIFKVKISEPQRGHDSKYLIYHKNPGLKAFLNILLGVVGMLVAACAAYAIYIIIVIFLWILGGSGCYIATMVYGSYEAPEVLMLRKYRDEKLAPYFWGRIFIRVYYTLSPVFVKVFKNNKPVNRFVKSILDQWVHKLRTQESAIDSP